MNKGRRIQLDELKTIQLDILNTVHEYCIDHNIKYFLAYGTLLGAVRHGGYIPWDDDIDIIMPRPDYMRFIKEFQHEYLRCFSYYSKSKDLIPFCKVSDTRTSLIEESPIKYNNLGVNIDVFPMDGLSSNYKTAVKHVKKVFFWIKVSEWKKMSYMHKRALYKNFIVFIVQTLLKPLSYQYVIKRLCNLMSFYDYTSSEYIQQLYLPKVNKILKRNDLENITTIEFEGKKYNCPNNYHILLKSLYGNYMELPPKDKRLPKHFFEAYWNNENQG